MGGMKMELVLSSLTDRVLGAAIEVHRRMGPGLLESAYRQCLLHEMRACGLGVEHEVPIPLKYKTLTVDTGFRADLIVGNSVLVELKSVERLLPVHHAQTLTYMKLANLRVGLLLNFHVVKLHHGIHRFVL